MAFRLLTRTFRQPRQELRQMPNMVLSYQNYAIRVLPLRIEPRDGLK
jgi:hypothetical protein